MLLSALPAPQPVMGGEGERGLPYLARGGEECVGHPRAVLESQLEVGATHCQVVQAEGRVLRADVHLSSERGHGDREAGLLAGLHVGKAPVNVTLSGGGAQNSDRAFVGCKSICYLLFPN